MAVSKTEIQDRATLWGVTGTLTPTARLEIGKQIQEEKERAAGVLMNERYVKAIENQNTVTAANTDALLSLESKMIAAIAALKPA